MPPETDFLIRPASVEDVPFIMKSWLKTLRAQGDAPSLPDDLFFAAYRPLVVRVLAVSQVRVACNPRRPTAILGYSVTSGAAGAAGEGSVGVLHWVYVRERRRRQGICRALIAHLPARPVHTFRTWATRGAISGLLGPWNPRILHSFPVSPTKQRSHEA